MSITLIKALAKEFIALNSESTESLEERVRDYVAIAKSSESSAVAAHLRKAIDGRKVYESVRRRLAIKTRAKQGSSKRSSSNGIEEFAEKALKAAQASKGKWHRHAYIYNAWQEMPSGMTLTDFKANLLKAHRADLLELGRADLVEAMSAESLKKSEITVPNYSYHFIRLEQ
jgi:hypothetical protein